MSGDSLHCSVLELSLILILQTATFSHQSVLLFFPQIL